MNQTKRGIITRLKGFYEKYPGENFGIATVILLIFTVGTSIILYRRIDPTFSFFTHYVSGLGGPPKGAPIGTSYLYSTVYNMGMLIASPLRIAFLLQVILFIKEKGAGLWLSRASLFTGLLASMGFLLMAFVPFSVNLDLHLVGALVYFVGATSFQLVFAVTELKTDGIPWYLPVIGLINLIVFSAFSYLLIQVEILHITGIPEPAFYEWLVFGSSILWVLSHCGYMIQERNSDTSWRKGAPSRIMKGASMNLYEINRSRNLLITLFVLILIITTAWKYVHLTGYIYDVPAETGDGWETSSLLDVNLSVAKITSMMNTLSGYDHPIHSIVIIKDGKLVFEKYYSGQDIALDSEFKLVEKEFNRDTLHCLASSTKSVTSILLGIAIDQGFIAGIDEKMIHFYPEYDSRGKEEISIKHMLTMSSGIPWDESHDYNDPRNNLRQQIDSKDPVEYVFQLPVSAPPGTLFIYNSGTTNVLGDIVSKTSGQTLRAFGEYNLFKPLGIVNYQWLGFPLDPDLPICSSTLYLRPRDMAKIGQLYLQNGEWLGRQLVSREWVIESTSQAIEVPLSESTIPEFITGYGHQWWRGELDSGAQTFFSAGYGGQFIFVVPQYELVIVFTGAQFQGDYYGFIAILNAIIDAVGV